MNKGGPHPKQGQRTLHKNSFGKNFWNWARGRESKPKSPGSAAHSRLPEWFAKDEEFLP